MKNHRFGTNNAGMTCGQTVFEGFPAVDFSRNSIIRHLILEIESNPIQLWFSQMMTVTHDGHQMGKLFAMTKVKFMRIRQLTIIVFGQNNSWMTLRIDATRRLYNISERCHPSPRAASHSFPRAVKTPLLTFRFTIGLTLNRYIVTLTSFAAIDLFISAPFLIDDRPPIKLINISKAEPSTVQLTNNGRRHRRRRRLSQDNKTLFNHRCARSENEAQ